MASNSRKAKHDIAPAMRAAFLEAIEKLKIKKGKTFSEIMADWLDEDPIAMMNAISKFTVRENHNTGSVTIEHSYSDLERANRLDALLESARARRDGQALEQRPVDTIEGSPDGSTLQ